MIRDQLLLDIAPEIIVDNFAGGGGASCGIELALGRHVDIAINHDPEAVAMHAMTHPQTEHHCESVWDVDPLDLVKRRPVGLAWHTVTTADYHALVSSHMINLKNGYTGFVPSAPVPTVTAGASHIGEVRAFLVKYYSEGGQDQDCRDPMHTIPTKDRLGLVTVAGEQYQIADIGMRMLEPHELYAAQGCPASYVIALEINGRRQPKHAQVRMCGNSVSPPMAAALVVANVPEMASWSREVKRTREAA
ncbi:hypothetical protein ASL20_09860 [Cupriavidus necator]|uniref:DNA cytosine methyltransferase n=1 Tax=Cupriavidus necator TaxID=106590 RepID=UPI000735A6E5|nr:DNA cytosine methyltransferase [Cupriavidus necator]KUE88917.1 hypothetical protein ASL20_09860 [Cupriavidus necator]